MPSPPATGVRSFRISFLFYQFSIAVVAAIYSASVGCAILHKVQKIPKKDLPTTTKITLKMPSDASKNASKNEAKT